jgi:hypothetical protein
MPEDLKMNPHDNAALSNDLLFGLINVLIPDASGVYTRPSQGGGEVWLNPQPLPPVAERPDPSRGANVSHTIISMASLTLRGAANEVDGLQTAKSMLNAFVEDFGGINKRPPMHLPPPWPRNGQRPNALDVIVAAAQFHAASKMLEGHALSAELQSGAEQLMKAALARLSRQPTRK